MSRVLPLLLETIGLQSSRGRVLFFTIASISIFLAPYRLLAELSLWQRVGIEAPTIGLTRAYWHVLHLDFASAWERNWLIFVVIAIGLPMIIMDMYKLVSKNKQK